MRMGRKALLFGLGLCLFLLSGCGLRGMDELYALPKPTPEYEQMQKCLEEVQEQGLELTAPLMGKNAQSVQMNDLDGDGVDEAIAFFRETSGESKPLRIYIFKQDESGAYDVEAVISGDGLAVNSVTYCQMDQTPEQELVISWQISGAVYTLSVYSLADRAATELLSASSYTRCCVGDLDRDNQEEMVIVYLDASDQGGSRADYYDWTESGLTLVGKAPLTREMQAIDEIEYAYLDGMIPALFVSGAGTELQTQQITDILVVRNGQMENIVWNPETGNSQLMVRALAENQDINSDRVMEIALPVEMPAVLPGVAQDSSYLTGWVQYDQEGSSTPVGYTYHNAADGWYLWVPESWVGAVSAVREDINEGSTVERAVHFYYHGGDGEAPKEFLSVYVNTGANRQTRSVSGNRILLTTGSDAIYSAEFHAIGWHCGLNAYEMETAFHLIQTPWSDS